MECTFLPVDGEFFTVCPNSPAYYFVDNINQFVCQEHSKLFDPAELSDLGE